MRIAIIGAGFTGLTAAYRLSSLGYETVVFEKESASGGLAGGFKDKKWTWTLEHHYHHLFTSDKAILNLAKELKHEIIFSNPKTSILYNNKISQLDSPFSLLNFPFLNIIDKIRTGLTLSYLRLTNYWKPLEKIYAKEFLIKFMGIKVWLILWQPLFRAKFGHFAAQIPASWFWARIKKRSAILGYPRNGFQSLFLSIQKTAQNHGTQFYFDSPVKNIKIKDNKAIVHTTKSGNQTFDAVIFTLSSSHFIKIAKGLPAKYTQKVKKLKGLGAINLVLSLRKKYFPDDTYWLNINDKNYPFLAIVEHTNFIKTNNYNNEHIIYIANYLEPTHPYFNLDENKLLEIFIPFLKKINPLFKNSWIKKAWKFNSSFAQPIFPLNYSRKLLGHKTPLKNLYLANMQQVYPWDRGTNYAVELGENIANLVHKNF